MSEMIDPGWLSDGFEPVSGALESLGEQLETARREPAAGVQAGEIARLTAEVEATTRRAVRLCEWFLPMMKWLWKATWSSAGRVAGTTWNSGGNHLRSVYDYTIGEMESTREWMATYERQLGCSLGLERVDHALSEARRMRADLESNWLWFTNPAEEEAKASIARGEGVDVEDAFAQMAGLSVAELRAKVEAHKRRYHPNGHGAR